MSRISFGAALALMVCLPSAIHAQWSPSATLDLGMGYGRMALSQAALNGARQLSKGSDEVFDRPASSKRADPEFAPRSAFITVTQHPSRRCSFYASNRGSAHHSLPS